jgi:hypothetical protein
MLVEKSKIAPHFNRQTQKHQFHCDDVVAPIEKKPEVSSTPRAYQKAQVSAGVDVLSNRQPSSTRGQDRVRS